MARHDERLYGIWCGIKTRTQNPRHKDYKYCGAKGISVCDEWKNSYESFRDWALTNGYQDNLTIDRIDNNGNYCPENCRWTDAYTQANNKSSNHLLTYNGKTQTMARWARETLSYRINSMGWSIEKALTTPVKNNKR